MYHIFSTKQKDGKYNIWLWNSDFNKKVRIARLDTKKEADDFLENTDDFFENWDDIYKVKLEVPPRSKDNKMWQKITKNKRYRRHRNKL